MNKIRNKIRNWLGIPGDIATLRALIEEAKVSAVAPMPQDGGLSIEATQRADYDPNASGNVVIVEPKQITKFRAGTL